MIVLVMYGNSLWASSKKHGKANNVDQCFSYSETYASFKMHV
jgi:hypothetical protein